MLKNSIHDLTRIILKAIFAEQNRKEGSSMPHMLEFFFVYAE